MTANGNTVTVTFNGTPGYSEFQDYLWEAPVVDKATWSKVPASQLITFADTHPIGTGPMLLDRYTAAQEAYKINPSWWGTSPMPWTSAFSRGWGQRCGRRPVVTVRDGCAGAGPGREWPGSRVRGVPA